MRVRAKTTVHDHLVDEFDYVHLSAEREYLVIGLDDQHFRVIDDAGEPILYPRALFDVIDSAIPEDWVHTRENDGGEYSDPPECAAPGFYEDYFDGDPKAITIVKLIAEKLSKSNNS